MNNGTPQTYITNILNKIVPTLLTATIISFVVGWNSINKDITKLQDNQRWMTETYKTDKKENKEDYNKLSKKTEGDYDKLLKKVEQALDKEDSMIIKLQEILTRLGVIEYELKIRNGEK